MRRGVVPTVSAASGLCISAVIRTCWETPQALFDQYHAEFGFTLDVCALPENAKVAQHYTPQQDGLQQPWAGVCWCNPPYGTVIGRWVQKACDASHAGALVVCLLPSRTGSGWWQRYVLPYAEIRYLDRRIKFVGAPSSAPFDSTLAIFRPVSH
jgi:phage N-6-adenine-methyltransferase